MTREEAIQYLSPIAESAALPRYKEALGMAIAALKEQGTDCKKNCIANVDGQCAVDSCSGAMTALDIKRPLHPETAAMLYNMARKMFEDWMPLPEPPEEQK